MEFKGLQESMASCSFYVQKTMNELLPEGFSDSRIIEAMRYSSLSGGKRVRPFLVMAIANIFNFPFLKTLKCATAIEFVHVYSLIHDDLPAMDNDDFRRGKLSNHKKFDEATAILAGDALLTFAFEILSSVDSHKNPEIRCELIKALSKAIGFRGMVGGQMIDIENIDKKISQEQIINLHRLKTGELFMASAECGAIIGGASIEERKAIRYYAHDLGLAFQIKDDILDRLEGVVGKNNLDKMIHKKPKENSSIVDIIGVESSERQVKILSEQAKSHLKIFEKKANILNELVDFLINRKN
jgi:farnesyl diphosphate synthase